MIRVLVSMEDSHVTGFGLNRFDQFNMKFRGAFLIGCSVKNAFSPNRKNPLSLFMPIVNGAGKGQGGLRPQSQARW